MLKGRKIVLGVSGGIACYKSCEIVSRLVKIGAQVRVIMTENSQHFVAPLSFETLSNAPVACDTFKRSGSYDVEHISLAKFAELLVIAPATANVVGKIANGIADDMLSTTVMATTCNKLICPAMNTAMYQNPIYQENQAKLKELGYKFQLPTEGRLACGDTGEGKMAEPIDIVETIVRHFANSQSMSGKKVMIALGGTQEPIDPVRNITNKSSGKMGMALAKACVERGADVTLIVGNITTPTISGVKSIIMVNTTAEMLDAVQSTVGESDYAIMAAAPGDYRVNKVADNKIKSDKITLELVKNPDIAKSIKAVNSNVKLVIFSAETQDLVENATKKLKAKNADLVVANDVTMSGAGFGTDTNVVVLIDNDGNVTPYEKMSKDNVAQVIIEKMLTI